MEEERDATMKGTEDMSSDEEDAPLPQPGDMHVEFKKSNLPDTVNKSKIQFIPFRLLQENKNVLCEKIVELEQEISKLKEENCVLKRKLKDKPITSSPPPAAEGPRSTTRGAASGGTRPPDITSVSTPVASGGGPAACTSEAS